MLAEAGRAERRKKRKDEEESAKIASLFVDDKDFESRLLVEAEALRWILSAWSLSVLLKAQLAVDAGNAPVVVEPRGSMFL
jgi:hypothetical protein